MALRRSNRRMTITGSSMFVASTPMVEPAIKENANFDDGNSSPQWVCAEEAFGSLKTPKLGKMTRRTTLTRQNIFNDETIIGGAVTDGQVFKPPSFFVPLSPPGVKTRSRRSSMHMGPPQPAKAKVAANPTGKKTINSNSGKNDTKTSHKVASKRMNDVTSSVKDQRPMATKVSSRKSLPKGTSDGGDSKFANIERLSPIVDTEVKMEPKKTRRSLRHIEEGSVMEINKSIALTHEFQTPRMPGVHYENRNFTSLITETPKVPVTFTPKAAIKNPESNMTNDSNDALAADGYEKITTQISSASRSVNLKRQMSREENEEIELVVKKMFTPSTFSEDLSFKQKLRSPNTGKASSSPARSNIMRDASNTARKSPARKGLETSVGPNTPSRAARKARKVLGVSTNSTPFNDNNQNQAKTSLGDKEIHFREESALSASEMEDVSFREENENNMTLSHSSHSQWCTIL